MVRMPIAEYLRDCGYNVLEAGDAAEAMAAVHSGGVVSLVFSDVRMPGPMDGFGLARWLQKNHSGHPNSADIGIQQQSQSIDRRGEGRQAYR